MLPAVHLTTYYRKEKDDFLHHAGMVNMLLHHQKDLLFYVVIACHKKMKNRLMDSLSEPYLQFLERIAMIPSSSTFPPFKNIAPDSLKNKHLSNDQKFFKVLPSLVFISGIVAPGLLQALSDPTIFNNPIKAYNEDTYKEYHKLLWKILSLFKSSLENLSKIEDAHMPGFEDFVKCTVLLGDGLRAMSGGVIIEAHLKVITSAQEKHRCVTLDSNQEVELDEELYEISSTLPPWEAYHEWLKLMVVHFDAVQILSDHMQTAKISEVTIKVISTPRPDKTLLPWKELLNNGRYFDEDEEEGYAVSDIVGFLEKWQMKQSTGQPDVHEVIKKLKSYGEGLGSDSDLDSRRVDDIIEEMKIMKACESPGYTDTRDKLISDMESLKGVELELALKLSKVDEIIIELQSLKDRAAFFAKLEEIFKGSVHGEVNLGCFMMKGYKLPEKYKEIVDELSVSCIVSTL